jgi:hypothetical protein
VFSFDFWFFLKKVAKAQNVSNLKDRILNLKISLFFRVANIGFKVTKPPIVNRLIGFVKLMKKGENKI